MSASRAATGVTGSAGGSEPPGIGRRGRLRRRRLRLAVFAAAALACGGAAAQQPRPGPAKAAACAACHGPLGIATLPTAPNLAGQPEGYLAEQLKAYRGGRRVHEMMSLIAKPLSDDDIAQLAAWYASIAVEARERP